jgi:hypothetical protein
VGGVFGAPPHPPPTPPRHSAQKGTARTGIVKRYREHAAPIAASGQQLLTGRPLCTGQTPC